MKNIFIAILSLTLSYHAACQDDSQTALSIGVLHGGGSLVGADLEILLTERIGVQIGGGIIGYGAGFNVHIKEGIRTSFVSFQYWHQGSGESFSQSVAGMNFVYRSKKWFTATIGLGKTLEKGPAWPESIEQPPIMLTYAIGAYLPF